MTEQAPDTNVRLCYECLTESDGHPDMLPGEVVAQGLCRRHLHYAYADEMFEEQHGLDDYDEHADDSDLMHEEDES